MAVLRLPGGVCGWTDAAPRGRPPADLAAAAVFWVSPSTLSVPRRSMTLKFKEEGVFEGIPTYRFKAPDTLFANGSTYPPNEGFCPCLESGIQNISTCRFSTCRPGGRVPRLAFGLIGPLLHLWPLHS